MKKKINKLSHCICTFKSMKHLLFALFLGILFTSCSKKSTDIVITEDIQLQLDAGEFLDNWHKHAAQADFDAYFNAIAKDGVYVGTDKTEVWSKEEFADFSRPFFEKGRAWDFKPIERNLYVSENENYIWFNETIDTWMGICRGSGVVEITGNKEKPFLIKHYVLSVTVPNEKIQDVIKAIEDKN